MVEARRYRMAPTGMAPTDTLLRKLTTADVDRVVELLRSGKIRFASTEVYLEPDRSDGAIEVPVRVIREKLEKL